MKSALNEIGQPLLSGDVQQAQMWERLSIKGLMDRVDRVFSLYPLSNKKLLEKERRRLDCVRNKPRPPPYQMAGDLMDKMRVPLLEDFGPEGLLGPTRT